MFTRYNVEIGDNLWNALFAHVNEAYNIVEVCEDNEQKFAILTNEDKYYRLDFSILEDGSLEFAEANILEEYTPAETAQFDVTAVEEYAKSKKEEEKTEDSEETGEEEKCPECGKPKSECTCEDEDEEKNKENKGKKSKYNLDEIQEYVELSEKYSLMENELNEVRGKVTSLEEENASLLAFKKSVEKVEKQKMIDSFYMLSDAEKADVLENIDSYSLDDIEAKLSIICVRNKVKFDLDENNEGQDNSASTTYNLAGDAEEEEVPAWVKRALDVAKKM